MRKLFALLIFLPLLSRAEILHTGTSGAVATNCSTGTANQVAACLTALNNGLCTAGVLGDYYWEIGNVSGPLVSGQVGTSITRTTLVQLDSASKMVYASYYVQSVGGVNNLTVTDVNFLHQRSGYTNEPVICPTAQSVFVCIQQTPGTGCSPASGYTVHSVVITSTSYGALCGKSQGLFHYGGGNFQVQAVMNGVAGLYNSGIAALATLINATFGIGTTYSYSEPGLAGGANSTGANMATWLQGILAGTVVMKGALGAYESCTNYLGNTSNTGAPSPDGPNAGNYIGQTLNGTVFGTPFNSVTVSGSTTLTDTATGAPNGPWISSGICQTNVSGYANSPIPENMMYSIGHWVETDPVTNGDGAFSSAGAKGVYPWIDVSKTYYGIIMRVAPKGGQGYNSLLCGRLLRRAYITGIQQTGTIPTP
jgi:hypothetical protein